MQISSLKPSPILQTFHYADLDEFRQAYRSVNVHFTPTCRSASPEQAILSLPGCDIYLLKTFPRVLDASLAEGHTFVGLTMNDRHPIRFNGLLKDRPALSFGYGGAGYKLVEDGESSFATIIFHPEVRQRGWPSKERMFCFAIISETAEQTIRDLITHVFMLVSSTSTDLVATAAEGIKETLLSAIDCAIAEQGPLEAHRVRTAKRYFDIVQKIEATIGDRYDAPIYSDALATEIGVSVRTMHNAMLQLRGMSLHRYLRMKRLWSVRKQLLSGGQPKIGACAVANGFWHLGEFSQFYVNQFGETPSQTVARAR